MEWSPESYAENARFVSDLGMAAVESLSPQPGERVLDLGCGDGALTAELSRSGCEVLAVDSSAKMVEAARRRGLDAYVVDGHSLPYSDEFDAVFSNAALHWMTDPEKVVDGVWRALRQQGRFVGEFGGHGNVATIVTAIESALSSRGLTVACPWYFPRPNEYQEILEGAGFIVQSICLSPRPTLLPGDVSGWLATFAHPYTAVVPAADRVKLVAEIVDDLRGKLVDNDGRWIADYVRLRFVAANP